jgi:hypothetical protein
MSKLSTGIVALVCFALGVAAAIAMFGCTPSQRTIARDAAAVADATCVLLLDLGAPDVVREVCDVEEQLYPIVDAALATAERAAATDVACPATPDAAPVLAVRRIGGRVQAPILIRDRAVLRLVVDGGAR